MAAINDLLQQITDPALRNRLEQEVARLSKNKKFGLVFEEHIPECTPLYGVAIKRGSTVARKAGQINDTFTVVKLTDDIAICCHKASGEMKEFAVSELISVAQFGEPIFPTLEPIDFVENAPDSDLWHTLVEADNYHALQLLEYLYPKQVDCIYIDPPYNTGARDWKYNNDYVDASDSWRHSKWLSMMQKRLALAKKVLNPSTGVMIVTIDEHEVHHLRVLLEEQFPGFYIQMVSAVINPKGVTQGRFSRVEEYVVYCFAPNAFVADSDDNLLNPPDPNRKPRWKGLLRSGTDALRSDRVSMFYPVFIDSEHQTVVKAGSYLPLPELPEIGKKYEGFDVAWPIRRDGSFGRWSVGSDTLNDLILKGYVSCGRYDAQRKTWGITYISQPNQQQIERGGIIITSRDPITGVVNIEYAKDDTRVIKTVWHRSYHDAGAYGSDLVSSIIGQSRAFSFPKSLYSTKDAISAVMRNNKIALILDFFAGSGTTLHAVNLLNAEDNGQRRCILVTNNEVSDSEFKELSKSGMRPGDSEWESHGICRSVTWPRTQYSILGKRADGTILTGEYYTNLMETKEINRTFYQMGFVDDSTELTHKMKKQIVSILRGKDGKAQLPQTLVKPDSKFIVSEKHTASILFNKKAVNEWLSVLEDQDHITDFYVVEREITVFNAIKERISDMLGTITIASQIKRPMSKGFSSNVEYFKLDFLDKNRVSLGRQFREILPLLWLKSGAIGRRPEIASDEEPTMLILPENRFAILVDETKFAEFAEKIIAEVSLETIYFVTNSEEAFRAMSADVKAKNTYQLYRDYIDNFVLGSRRN
jgi:Adenine specific DNA methylase Mod